MNCLFFPNFFPDIILKYVTTVDNKHGQDSQTPKCPFYEIFP